MYFHLNLNEHALIAIVKSRSICSLFRKLDLECWRLPIGPNSVGGKTWFLPNWTFPKASIGTTFLLYIAPVRKQET